MSNTSVTDHLDIERYQGDVRDIDAVTAAMAGCGAVYYCAIDTRGWAKDTSQLRLTNIDGLRNVMEAAMEADVKRFVYTSTYMTIGTNPSGVSSEADAFNWWDSAPEYVRVRVEAEDLFLSYCEKGLPGVACNVVMTYGKDDIQPTAHGWMVERYAKGDIRCVWDVNIAGVGIEDAAEAMLLAEERGRIGERYIIAERSLPLREFANTIKNAAGRPAGWLPTIPIPLMS
jgi:dihydroflavonol-4-reductase